MEASRGAHPALLRPLGRAGGRPAVDRATGRRRVEETLDAIDGLILSGGADIDPELYGAEAHPRRRSCSSSATGRARAARGGARPRAAGARDLPRDADPEHRSTAAICTSTCPSWSGHERHRETPEPSPQHDVRLEPREQIAARCSAERTRCKSSHHQGIDRVGEALTPVGLGRGRDDRGDRGSGPSLRRRRPLAPGGRRGQAPVRGPRRGGAQVPHRAARVADLTTKTVLGRIAGRIPRAAIKSLTYTSHMHARRRVARCRWRVGDRWLVRARVERFVEPALLLLLRQRPMHGYDLLEQVSQLTGDDRGVDLGNLYRVLRALEEDGLSARSGTGRSRDRRSACTS